MHTRRCATLGQAWQARPGRCSAQDRAAKQVGSTELARRGGGRLRCPRPDWRIVSGRESNQLFSNRAIFRRGRDTDAGDARNDWFSPSQGTRKSRCVHQPATVIGTIDWGGRQQDPAAHDIKTQIGNGLPSRDEGMSDKMEKTSCEERAFICEPGKSGLCLLHHHVAV